MTEQNKKAEPSGASGGSLANAHSDRQDAEARIIVDGIAEIMRIASEPDWIPVTERLPERNEIVLATDQGGVTVGSYSPMLDDWWTLHGDRIAPGAVVTHWMPLPAPPTDDK